MAATLCNIRTSVFVYLYRQQKKDPCLLRTVAMATSERSKLLADSFGQFLSFGLQPDETVRARALRKGYYNRPQRE